MKLLENDIKDKSVVKTVYRTLCITFTK